MAGTIQLRECSIRVSTPNSLSRVEVAMVKGTRGSQTDVILTGHKHTFVSGLLAKDGGKEDGPDPHELLEGSLAACTIMTCQLYANRKGWDLGAMEVTARIESESKTESKIVREITFKGELSEEQIKRLMQIADMCPIHRLLQSQVTIETKRV